MNERLMNLALVFLGGGCGALSRFGLTALLNPFTRAIPLGTLAENLFGSLLIGLMIGLIEGKLIPGNLRFLVITGFIGAFTTFSTYALETVNLAVRGNYRGAILNFLLQNMFGFLAVLAGLYFAEVLRGLVR